MGKNVAITVNPLYEASDGDHREMEHASNGALEACKRWVRGYGFPSHRVTPSMEQINVAFDSERRCTVSSESENNFSSGLSVTFKELNYSVRSSTKRGEKIKLLMDVSGYLLPGQLAALMGPSGSSKTTLLDVLASRKTVGTLTGTLLFGGQRATRTFLRRYIGYVEQFDTLLDNLTVYEMLIYTAELKNPMSVPFNQKVERVNSVIGQLALNTCRDVRIGSALQRGISGGQSKRVNIGIALVTNPRVLFLDEPTSGLDSFTANEVMG
eukprot:jgi/Botrbrau1/3522/Bobra.341_2s0049.1